MELSARKLQDERCENKFTSGDLGPPDTDDNAEARHHQFGTKGLTVHEVLEGGRRAVKPVVEDDGEEAEKN